MRLVDDLAREAIQQGASIRQVQEEMVKQALMFYCNVSRAAIALGWQRPAVAKRMKAIGLTIEDLRKFKAAQRKLPLKPQL